MEVLLFFPAKYIDRVTAEDNVFHTIGAGFHRVRIDEAPYLLPSLHVAAKLSLSSEEVNRPHQMMIRLINPEGAEIAASNLISIPATELKPDRKIQIVSLVLSFEWVIFPKQGHYRLELLFDDKVEKNWPLHLEVVPPIGQNSI